jgi:uncharacterized protein (DUF58 family)
MSPQKRSAKKPKRGHASVTPFGIAFLVTGPTLLAAGLLNGELAAILSGATLILYAAFSAVLVALAAFFWRKALVTAEWTGLEHITIHATPSAATQPLALSLLFCDIRYAVRYYPEAGEQGSRTFTLSVPITRAEVKQAVTMPGRGYYHGSIPTLSVSDFSALFRFEKAIPDAQGSGELVVPAEPESCALPTLPPGRSGQFAGKSTFRRSDELYESRQYLPGDDPRKINWKIYAHTGSLAIREGELLPPPSAEYVLIVNPCRDRALRGEARKAAERRYERLVRRATFVALRLSEKRRIVTVITETAAGTTRHERIAPDAGDCERAIRAAFARCALRSEENGQTPIQSTQSGNPDVTYLFFTLPDQPVRFMPGQTDAVVLLGPVPEKPLPWSPKRELLRYVFLDAEKESDLSGAGYRARYSEAFNGLKKEGFDVQGI